MILSVLFQSPIVITCQCFNNLKYLNFSDDICDQLCERVLSVLVELWLIACVRCFPSPALWKTLREMCMNWRHRIALIEQWNRIHLALTAKLLDIMYGPSFPLLKISAYILKIICL